MRKADEINEVWLKASILGSTWAASEIILGSFLHNLRIPFNGHILTAIAFILLIAASYRWADKGLFWRSGLICALMKTMSPSAIIFGPMIAIFMEALLLDISVRILGKNLAGFMLGSALAMSWILVQRILNLIISYGFNIVDIYKDLMKYAEKQLHLSFDMIWTPILILLAIYIIFGFIAVFLGMKIGRSLEKERTESLLRKSENEFSFKNQKNSDFNYSITWLTANVIVLVAMLFIIGMTPVYVWTILTIVVIFIWTRRYKRGMRQLARPRFWIWFVALTMISAFVITAIQGSNKDWLNGLMTGLQMNFRAAVVIIGFSVLGTELYNPKIRNYFARTSFRQLPIALEFAFDSLPAVIGSLPEVKFYFTQPAKVITSLINQAEERLQLLRKIIQKPMPIITGELEEGKTGFASQLAIILKNEGLRTGGFVSPRIIENNKTIGYKLERIANKESCDFLRLNTDNSKSDIGRFNVNAGAFATAHNWLEQDSASACDILIIDEVGKWEISGKGWKNELDAILNNSPVPMVWTVRKSYLEDIITAFNLNDPLIFDVSLSEPVDAAKIILQKFVKSDIT